MKQSKDPFEVAFEEEEVQEEAVPPDSPVVAPDNAIESQTEDQMRNIQATTAGQSESATLQLPVDVHNTTREEDYDDDDYDNDNEPVTNNAPRPPANTTATKTLKSRGGGASASLAGKAKEEEEEEEEEENMDVELGNPSTSDPDKMSKMQYFPDSHSFKLI